MSESHDRFVSESIQVHEGDGVSGPSTFTWRGHRLTVRRVVSRLHDYGSPATAAKPDWRTRRHRNVFDVELDDGRRARIYLERGTKLRDRRTWVLERISGSAD